VNDAPVEQFHAEPEVVEAQTRKRGRSAAGQVGNAFLRGLGYGLARALISAIRGAVK
jgi:hypothetical protein